MKLLYIIVFFGIANSEFIKNGNLKSCKNCIYYKPGGYITQLSKCHNFGVKNVVDDTINYEYAEKCRSDELKCGLEGKYFKKDNFAYLKEIKNNIYITIPLIYLFIVVLTLLKNVI
jgi:hypothetical protein